MDTPLIETRGLKKYFHTPSGPLHAVDDVNLKIEKGKTLGVVGESGCGKSTLGRTVLRLLNSTGGQVFYNGEDITQYPKDKMKQMTQKMQIVFQDPYSSLNPRMTVFDIIADPIRVQNTITGKEELEDKVFSLMDTVGLAERWINTYPHEMDGGRRQRIGIARALALDPEFIVCDEPVSALDVSIQAQILNLMMDLQDNIGLTYMFITHDLSVVKHISDEIMVMYLGQCVERAPSHALFSNPAHPYTQALMDAIPTPDLSRRGAPRKILRGEVTSPINPKPGCRFAPRCSKRQKSCDEITDFVTKEIGENHFCSCIQV